MTDNHKGRAPWYGWAATLTELRTEVWPHIPTLAEGLRADEPVPEEVRMFLADVIEGKRTRPRRRPKAQNVIEREIEDNLVRAVFEFEYENAKGEWTPTGVSPLDHFIAGSPYEVALTRTKAALSEHGIDLSEDWVKGRLAQIKRKT